MKIVPRLGVVARIIFLLFLLPSFIFSQPTENKFIDALIYDKDNLTDFVDADELARSSSLQVQYDNVKHKWLISFDIPDEIKSGFRNGIYNYSLQTLLLEDGFSVVTLAVGSINYLQKFYFLNDRFVSPSRYFTRNWEKKESKYFRFNISEPRYFNDYCIKRLDDFADSLCALLEIDPERKRLLETEKLFYTFCADENEVEKITGYKSKGMSVLAYDEVISAYQTHFHEAAHLLINYRLQKLGLYTAPFFMEGFAVALGGRGGLAASVVTDLGYFLQRSGYLTYDSILTYDAFYSQDANMTYAVSGLYNLFLLDELGGTNYLALYKEMNGDLDFVKKLIPVSRLSSKKFESFLLKFRSDSLLIFGDNQSAGYNCFPIGSDSNIFALNCQRLLNGDYVSRAFTDITGKVYQGEHYLVKKDSGSIKVYNCYNNEQVFSYERNFTLDPLETDLNKYFCLKNALFECRPDH